jgi:hypothetical protein
MSESFSNDLKKKNSLSSVVTADVSKDHSSEEKTARLIPNVNLNYISETNFLAPDLKPSLSGLNNNEPERNIVSSQRSRLKTPLLTTRSAMNDLLDEKKLEGYEVLLGDFYQQLVDSKKKNLIVIEKNTKKVSLPKGNTSLANISPAGFVPSSMIGKQEFQSTFMEFLDGKCSVDSLMNMKNFPSITSKFQEIQNKKKHIRKRLTNAFNTVKLGNVRDSFTNIVRKGLNNMNVEKVNYH